MRAVVSTTPQAVPTLVTVVVMVEMAQPILIPLAAGRVVLAVILATAEMAAPQMVMVVVEQVALAVAARAAKLAAVLALAVAAVSAFWAKAQAVRAVYITLGMTGEGADRAEITDRLGLEQTVERVAHMVAAGGLPAFLTREVLEPEALFGSYGRGRVAAFQQQTQETCDGTVYPDKRWTAV